MQTHSIHFMLLACVAVAPCMAAVTPEEAGKLKTTLTPLGAERAGNADGTIPAWTGGHPAAPQFKGKIPEVYTEDKPLFTITQQNLDKYADKLSDGSVALFKKYPSYRLVVYPTRRSGAAPQWVYENTFKNATRAVLTPGSMGPFPKGAYGGTPFPIPKTGEEAVWNHLLKWSGESFANLGEQGRITPDGKLVVVQQARGLVNFIYYDPTMTLEKWEAAGAEKDMRRGETLGPPIRTGEMILQRSRMDDSQSLTYSYLTGQRRVRRLPLACCDVPNPLSGGIANFDELGEVYSGSIGRYDWKLLGKREMYVPYNANKYHQPKTLAEVLTAPHVNLDLIRYELHRVWVIEAILKPGERHTAPRVRLYLDEDTWMGVMADRWDAQGQLWKASFAVPTVMPTLPGTVSAGLQIHDMVRGGYFATTYNVGQDQQYKFGKPFPEKMFTPEAISAEGMR